MLSLFHLNGLACSGDKQLALQVCVCLCMHVHTCLCACLLMKLTVLQLARSSAAAGSRYGQYALGYMLHHGRAVDADAVSAAVCHPYP